MKRVGSITPTRMVGVSEFGNESLVAKIEYL